jgi:hypothetical protein
MEIKRKVNINKRTLVNWNILLAKIKDKRDFESSGERNWKKKEFRLFDLKESWKFQQMLAKNK